MLTKGLSFGVLLLTLHFLQSQDSSQNFHSISIETDDNFQGYDLMDLKGEKLFVLAEHWHNIKSVPKATLKLLEHLHRHADVRILAIEQGASTAYLINKYLDSGDTTILRQITRNTMFWGKENRAFFVDLRNFNATVSLNERISVRSIDIEYKMESAIFLINELLTGKDIPNELIGTLGQFQGIFEKTRAHRESFEGLSTMFYYDKKFVEQLILHTLYDLEKRNSVYMDFFEEDFIQFAQMILDMDDGLTFDYTNPNTKYRFRDKIIYQKFVELLEENPHEGILCVIGLRHATKPSSIYKLQNSSSSPIRGKVLNIRISALLNKSIVGGDLRRINYHFPRLLKSTTASIIKHDSNDPVFKAKEGFDYTIFINQGGMLTPYSNVLEQDY